VSVIRCLPSRRRPCGDAGFTLVELLITMVILGIVGAMTVTIVTNTLQTTRAAQERSITITQAQTALERLARDIRTADPLVVAAANDMTLDVYFRGHCERHRWYVDANAQLILSKQSWAPSDRCSTKTGSPGAVTSQVQLGNAGVDNTNLIFRYWRQNPDTSLTEITPPVPAADRRRVDKVEVTVRGVLARQADPLVLTTSVDLRNVEQYR
jgi:prepilin-type N-terminal cleavage/methylation domain-containing protein